jgi:GT2 family glycosyltransferase
VSASSPPILAVVPSYLRTDEDLDVLLRCLVSLSATAPRAQVLIVDDHSPGERLALHTEAAADELGMAYVRKDENSGFAATVNVGLAVAQAQGRDALLVNADLEFRWRGWLEALLDRRDTQGRPAAVVGARLVYPNGLIQHGGIYFSRLHRYFDHRFRYGPADLPEALVPVRCPVTAALQLIRHACLDRVGLYDEEFGLAFEDVDYCLRVFEAGLECVYEPAAKAVHVESLFRARKDEGIERLHAKSVERLSAKHRGTDMSAWTPAIR